MAEVVFSAHNTSLFIYAKVNACKANQLKRLTHPVIDFLQCLPTYIGSPPNCRPECTINPDCPLDKACKNLKCEDPCRGACGFNAECKVVNHQAFCSCPPGFQGDPFSGCQRIPPPPPPPLKVEPRDPCVPSPCGPNADSTRVGDRCECSCHPGYIGAAPYCRPECTANSDCPSHLACIRQKCQDPCPGSCGSNALCTVVNHSPVCTCLAGFIGNAFSYCYPEPKVQEEIRDPCVPSPCGSNAQCHNRNSVGACQVITTDYYKLQFSSWNNNYDYMSWATALATQQKCLMTRTVVHIMKTTKSNFIIVYYTLCCLHNAQYFYGKSQQKRNIIVMVSYMIWHLKMIYLSIDKMALIKWHFKNMKNILSNF